MKIWQTRDEREEVLEGRHTVGTAATAPVIVADLIPEKIASVEQKRRN